MHILIEPQSVTDRASAIVLDNSSLAKRSLAKGNSKRGLHTFIHTYLLTPRVQGDVHHASFTLRTTLVSTHSRTKSGIDHFPPPLLREALSSLPPPKPRPSTPR